MFKGKYPIPQKSLSVSLLKIRQIEKDLRECL